MLFSCFLEKLDNNQYGRHALSIGVVNHLSNNQHWQIFTVIQRYKTNGCIQNPEVWKYQKKQHKLHRKVQPPGIKRKSRHRWWQLFHYIVTIHAIDRIQDRKRPIVMENTIGDYKGSQKKCISNATMESRNLHVYDIYSSSGTEELQYKVVGAWCTSCRHPNSIYNRKTAFPVSMGPPGSQATGP